MNEPTKIRPKDLPRYQAKVKGDAGMYDVLAIDWLHLNIWVYRAASHEKLPFKKIQYIIEAREFGGCE